MGQTTWRTSHEESSLTAVPDTLLVTTNCQLNFKENLTTLLYKLNLWKMLHKSLHKQNCVHKLLFSKAAILFVVPPRKIKLEGQSATWTVAPPRLKKNNYETISNPTEWNSIENETKEILKIVIDFHRMRRSRENPINSPHSTNRGAAVLHTAFPDPARLSSIAVCLKPPRRFER